MGETDRGADQARTALRTFNKGELMGIDRIWRQFRGSNPTGTPVQALRMIPRGEDRERFGLGLSALNTVIRRGLTIAEVDGVSISQIGNDVSTRRYMIIPPPSASSRRPSNKKYF